MNRDWSIYVYQMHARSLYRVLLGIPFSCHWKRYTISFIAARWITKEIICAYQPLPAAHFSQRMPIRMGFEVFCCPTWPRTCHYHTKRRCSCRIVLALRLKLKFNWSLFWILNTLSQLQILPYRLHVVDIGLWENAFVAAVVSILPSIFFPTVSFDTRKFNSIWLEFSTGRPTNENSNLNCVLCLSKCIQYTCQRRNSPQMHASNVGWAMPHNNFIHKQQFKMFVRISQRNI